MTTFVPAQSLSYLTDYSGLIAAVGRWLNRPDLEDSAPDFIRLAEARFRRVLTMPEMEKILTFATEGANVLPADFDSMRAITAGNGKRALTVVSPQAYYDLCDGSSGEPQHYALISGQIFLWPNPAPAYTAQMVYLANLPALGEGVDTNWLLDKHPDAYLFGTLAQAEFYGWNDDRLTLIKTALDEMLDEISMAGARKRYGGGPLAARPAVREGVRGVYR